MITPNKITLYRIILTTFAMLYLYLFYQDAQFFAKMVVCAVWFLIVLMDSIDGYIARSRNLQSVYGATFDSMADGLCMFALYFFMVEIDIIPLWFVYLLLVRDFVVNFIFRISMLKSIFMSSTSLGKSRIDLMGFLLVGIFCFKILGGGKNALFVFAPILVMLVFMGNFFGYDASYKKAIRIVSFFFSSALIFMQPALDQLVQIYIVMALFLTFATMFEFVWQARAYIFAPKAIE